MSSAVDANGVGTSESAETSATTYTVTPNLAIRDNSTVSSQVNVSATGSVGTVRVTVDIAHTYIGDLIIQLEHNGKKAILRNHEGGGTANLQTTFTTEVFANDGRNGTWTLSVTDSATRDEGVLRSWQLAISDLPPPRIDEAAFDASSCMGPALDEAQLINLVGAGNHGVFLGTRTPLLTRSRRCDAATGCGSWGPATIEQSSLPSHAPYIMKGAIRVEQAHRFSFSLVDADERSVTASAQCSPLPGGPTISCNTTMRGGGATGWMFCRDGECPMYVGDFTVTLTNHCARFHGIGHAPGTLYDYPTTEWAALVRF
jgi:hypothetical protein